MDVNEIESYFDRLWPLNRSLTGEGNRQTIKILSELVPFNVTEVPAGTSCYDWKVPAEWNVKEAWIKDTKGNIIIDFSNNNLHLMGYSIACHELLSYDNLIKHLYYIQAQPEAIPYRTSYYTKRWGFCLSYNQFLSLNPKEQYEVFIDSCHNEEGSMTVAEAVIEGESKEEIVFSSYICHPSLANNELSGPLVLCYLYSLIRQKLVKPRYTYCFLLMPETIGSIWYISHHFEHLQKYVKGGMILTCIGDAAPYSLKKSRRGDSLLEAATEYIAKSRYPNTCVIDFFPLGSDERQYCSPGVNLPFCSLMHSVYGTFKEYHTSLDNKSYISFEVIQQSTEDLYDVIRILENDGRYFNQMPMCEPQLGKRGLYPTISAPNARSKVTDAMMWILNYSDGKHTLFDILKKAQLPIGSFLEAKDVLIKNGILKYEE